MTSSSVVKGKMPKALGLAVWISGAVLVCGVPGCAGDRYEQNTGEHIDDGATSMRVKHALGEDPQYKYPLVAVKTFKGVTQIEWFRGHAGPEKARCGYCQTGRRRA